MTQPTFSLSPSRKKATVVAEAITEAITHGHYKPGQKLPSERDIAEKFGVSRGVIREALSALQIAGFVRIKMSEGTFVCELPKTGSDNIIDLLERSESPLELWEARREIETIVAINAARGATKKDFSKISRILEEMMLAVAKFDLEAYLQADNDFHRTILAPANNRLLYQLAENLLEKTHQLVTREPVVRYVQGHLARSLEKHQDIARAYQTRDPNEIGIAVGQHFRELEEFYLEE